MNINEKNIYISRRKSLAGIAGLSAFPFLEINAAAKPEPKYKRLVVVTLPYGTMAQYWTPDQVGPNYNCRYAEIYKDVKQDLSILTNLSHGNGIGHVNAARLLSGVGINERNKYENKNESVDQFLGRHIGSLSRYPSLTLGGGTYSWSKEGVKVPELVGSDKIYRQLFIPDSAEAIKAKTATLKEREMQLKVMENGAKSLSSILSSADNQKLQEYQASILTLKENIFRRKKWMNTTKKRPKDLELAQRPTGSELVENTLEMTYWALMQNLSRVVTVSVSGKTPVKEFGGSRNWHNNTHHGMLPDKIEFLRRIESMAIEKTVNLIKKLKATQDPEGSGTMLDNTMVLFASGMSSGNSHSCSNLPIMIAGGGLKHGNHITYGEKRNAADMLYTLVRNFGVEVDHFNKSNKVLDELV